MSDAARRPESAIGSITEFQSQIVLFTFLGTVDSSADLAGAFGRPVHAAALPAVEGDDC
jgi:hypothetical protein